MHTTFQLYAIVHMEQSREILWLNDPLSHQVMASLQWTDENVTLIDFNQLHNPEIIKQALAICYAHQALPMDIPSDQELFQIAHEHNLEVIAFVSTAQEETDALTNGATATIMMNESVLMKQKLQKRLDMRRAFQSPMFDFTTRAYSRSMLPFIIQQCLSDERQKNYLFSVALCQIDETTREGEQAFVQFFQQKLRRKDLIIRWSHGQFILILFNMKQEMLASVFDRIQTSYQQEFSARIVGAEMFLPAHTLDSFIEKLQLELSNIAVSKERALTFSPFVHVLNEEEKETYRIAILQNDAFTKKLLMKYAERLTSRRYTFEIQSFNNGQEFFSSAWSRSYDPYLLIIDTKTAQIGAVEFMKKLRASYPKHQYSVFSLTNRSNDSELIELLAYDLSDHIMKPFSIDELLTKLKRIIEGER
ncbi:response regulator [Bacillus sp. REN10]|uniref:response regulator n=1 Tax=Bacillus sp. REN10 TaxID=2782541 RepID=UPI00193B3EFC|nr:response regulator [Bacillus sp. REN10]